LGVPDFQNFSDDWVPYHAAMEPLRKQFAATHAAAVASGVAITTATVTTSTSTASGSAFLAQFTALATPAGIAFQTTMEVLRQIISDMYHLLRDNAPMMIHWGERFAAWLHHVAIMLIHLTHTGFH
jgi:hypothetical protein